MTITKAVVGRKASGRALIESFLSFSRIMCGCFSLAVILATSAQEARPVSRDTPSGLPEEGLLGLVLKKEAERIVISDVLVNSPAHKSGTVRPGMVLLAIAEGGAKTNFVTTGGMSLGRVGKEIRGPVGSHVALKIRGPASELEDAIVELIRVPQEAFLTNGVLRGSETLEFRVQQPAIITNPPIKRPEPIGLPKK